MQCRIFVLLVAGTLFAALEGKNCAFDPYFPFVLERFKSLWGTAANTLSLEVEKEFEDARYVVRNRERLDNKIVESGFVITLSDRVSDLSNARRFTTDPATRMRELTQVPFETVTKRLMKKIGLRAGDFSDVPINGRYGLAAKKDCEAVQLRPNCDRKSKYRTFDGTCNNLESPIWGSTRMCLTRIFPAVYDGQSGFRKSVKGGHLPEPRDLSIRVHAHLDVPHERQTQLGNFFGQLLDHDLTQAPSSITAGNNAIECCGKGPKHPQCAPIKVRKDDPFFSKFGTRCINFVRSALCPTCKLGAREQVNQITSFVDASFVYGNSLNESNPLRTFDGTGRLRVEHTMYGDMMPKYPDPRNDKCSFPETKDYCFLSGDPRGNQHRTLASLHVVFLREHNRLAAELKKINPHWGGETLFQEARRIIGAMVQVITYNEFLSNVLSKAYMDKFGLWLSPTPTTYDPKVDPSIWNEFSAASFRSAHSAINSITLGDRDNRDWSALKDEYFQPFPLRCGLLEPILEDMAVYPSQKGDVHLVDDVRNYLYRSRSRLFGLDLASINIQRGRDNGLPSYSQMVKYCSNYAIDLQSFEELVSTKLMDEKTKTLLKENYKTVKDIDLWTGIVAETNKFTGPCITGQQFMRLKLGDRFYFEHSNQAGSFSIMQMKALKKVTLTSLMCRNTNVQKLPMYCMKYLNETSNPVIKCNDVKGLDLSYWRE